MEEMCIMVDENDLPLEPASKVQTHLVRASCSTVHSVSFSLTPRGACSCSREHPPSTHSHHSGPTHAAATRYGMTLRWESKLFTAPNTSPGPGFHREADPTSALLSLPSCWGSEAYCCYWFPSPRDLEVERGVDGAAIEGAKRAAVRKLEQELGISPSQLTTADFTYLTKIQYISQSDGVWGEHEIDYVFFAQADVDLDLNPNEVDAVDYVDRAGLRDYMARAEKGDIQFTPWSKVIIERWVFDWWDVLEQGQGQQQLQELADDYSVTHRVGAC
ncbi:unnamed protein product [Chrysoparadoxa australica]